MNFRLNEIYTEKVPVSFGSIAPNRLAKTLRDGRASALLVFEHLLARFENLRRFGADPRVPDCVRLGNRVMQVRLVTENGVALNPHKQNGFGRRYDRGEYHRARRLVNGYLLVDVTKAPEITYSYVPMMRVPGDAKFSCKDAQSLISLATDN